MIFYVKSEIFDLKSVDIQRSGKNVTWLEDRKIIELFYQRSEQAIIELSRKYSPAIRKTAGNIAVRFRTIFYQTRMTQMSVSMIRI